MGTTALEALARWEKSGEPGDQRKFEIARKAYEKQRKVYEKTGAAAHAIGEATAAADQINELESRAETFQASLDKLGADPLAVIVEFAELLAQAEAKAKEAAAQSKDVVKAVSPIASIATLVDKLDKLERSQR